MSLYKFYIKNIKTLFFFTKSSFVCKLNKNASILDIGCGNHSPYKTKIIRPDLYYVGVDIDYYSLDNKDKELANEFHIFNKENFFNEINNLDKKFDSIMCAHVIEHLDNYEDLFNTFSKKIKEGGLIYLSTPNINSINLPSTNNNKYPNSKRGTLNYYDDITHTKMPLHFYTIYELCKAHNLKIIKYRLRSKSLITFTLGFFMEFFRLFKPKVYPFTYQYWGFEDIYILSK